MYFVLSPAKNLNEKSDAPTKQHTLPLLLDQAALLIPALRQLAPQNIAKLMNISDRLAVLNAERFSRWHTPFDINNAKQAIYTFNGDVYEGLDAATLASDSINYLQKNTGLLSGLYGLLRPLDLIQPYRLEMGIKLINPRGKDLYTFWGERITQLINEIMTLSANTTANEDNVLINLASKEYFKAIQSEKLHVPIITPIFKDNKNGQYKIISFYAKRARGLMMRYAAQHQITQAAELQCFNAEGYYFSAAHSNTREWVFLREKPLF